MIAGGMVVFSGVRGFLGPTIVVIRCSPVVICRWITIMEIWERIEKTDCLGVFTLGCAEESCRGPVPFPRLRPDC